VLTPLLVVGELASWLMPNPEEISASALWDSARPGVPIAAMPRVRSVPDTQNHADSQASGVPKAGVKAQVSGARSRGVPRAPARLLGGDSASDVLECLRRA
jgi:hypothetical protein